MAEKSKSRRDLLIGALVLLATIALFMIGLVTFVSQTELFRPKDTDFALSCGLLALAITGLGIFFGKWGKL